MTLSWRRNREVAIALERTMDGTAMKVTPLKTAGALLLLALILLVVGFVRGQQVRAAAVAFAREGVETTGTVLNKTSELVRNSQR